jgi:hypothetical protein
VAWPVALASVAISIAVVGCQRSPVTGSAKDGGRDMVTLTFRLELDTRVYEDSTWGDPPQLAIWIRDPADNSAQTVMVTHRTGAGDWVGKVDCPVALPYWVACYSQQTGTQGPPTWDDPAPDALTGATPRAELIRDVRVPRDTRWEYFIEVNVSGDFNADYPKLSDEGLSDTYGNGQPSLVYRGVIDAVEGSTSRPEVIGRTAQYEAVDRVDDDLDGITTARELLRRVYVSCAE